MVRGSLDTLCRGAALFSLVRFLRDYSEHRDLSKCESAEAQEVARVSERETRRRQQVPNGMWLPRTALEVPQELRDLTPDDFDHGGAGVGATIRPDQLVDVLRPRRWSDRAGVTRIGGLEGSGTVVLPRHSGKSSVHWLRDGATRSPNPKRRTRQRQRSRSRRARSLGARCCRGAFCFSRRCRRNCGRGGCCARA